VFIILGEIFISHWQHLKLYTLKGTLCNLYLMLLNSGIDLAFRLVYLFILAQCFAHAFYLPKHHVWYWVILAVAEDFVFYWLHRMEHVVRLFWAVHVTHHSSEEFNFSVGFRSSVFQPLYRFIFFIPLAFVGFAPPDIVFMYSATQIWGIFVHTKLINKMGWLEYILVTPSHHRVHHASNPKYLDKNMGMLFIIWDKLFGTFQAELAIDDYQPIRYGLTYHLPNQNPINMVLQEWKNIRQDVKRPVSFKTKLAYMLMPPGWSHDGSRMTTSQQMREREKD
jgi:sterol desaturase/sphingolipid hydroxylase (fatty acid hydroxylase superfamily)